MTKRKTILLSSIAAVVLLVAGAWLKRPAILRFLAIRQLNAARSIVGSYLAGSVPFDSAASRLAPKLEHAATYFALAEPSTEGGGNTASMVSFDIVPEGYDNEDPRIQALVRRAMILSLPPAERPYVERSFREADSVSAASRRVHPRARPN